MNYLKKITILIILSFLFGCSTQNKKEEKNVLFGISSDELTITCIHKYEESISITFYEDSVQRFVLNNITQFRIVGIDNKEYFLSIYEIENYICTRNDVP